jgi:hypothetical protein
MMSDGAAVLKSNLLDQTKAQELISSLVRGGRVGKCAATKVEIFSDKWNAVIKEHNLSDNTWKRYTIECTNNDKKFLTIYLQSKALDVFQLLGFTKFLKRAMDVDSTIVLIKGETQEVINEEEVEDPDSAVIPFVFQCPQCGRKFKTSTPQVQMF